MLQCCWVRAGARDYAPGFALLSSVTGNSLVPPGLVATQIMQRIGWAASTWLHGLSASAVAPVPHSNAQGNYGGGLHQTQSHRGSTHMTGVILCGQS